MRELRPLEFTSGQHAMTYLFLLYPDMLGGSGTGQEELRGGVRDVYVKCMDLGHYENTLATGILTFSNKQRIGRMGELTLKGSSLFLLPRPTPGISLSRLSERHGGGSGDGDDDGDEMPNSLQVHCLCIQPCVRNSHPLFHPEE